ncbi:MAG: hypothetical protein ACI9VR_000829 [Cognaticolwellia sp.]|jgi:hypothetical protein
MSGQGSRGAGWLNLVVYVLLLGLILGVRLGLELALPLGSDAAMWGLSAMGLLVGELPQIAPVFPFLVAAVAKLSGLPVWRIGSLVSVVCAAALPLVVHGASRDLGAGRWTALSAAVAASVLPDVVVFFFQLQPDALAALLLVLAAWLGMRWERSQSHAALAQWLVCLLLLALTREHGQVIVAGLPLYFLVRRKPLWALALLVLGALALTALVQGGGLLALPERIAQPLLESPLGAGQGPTPHFYSELRGAQGEGQRLWTQGRALPVFLFNFSHLFGRHADSLWILVLGALGFGALARRDGVGGAGLLALLPAAVILLVWSNQRHSALLLPVGVLGIACGFPVLRGWRPAAGVAMAMLSLLGFGWSMRDAPAIANRLMGAAHHAGQTQGLTQWMAELPGEWMLGGVDNEPNLFLGWPRVAEERPECAVLERPGPLWRTLWIAPAGVMPAEWEQLHQQGPSAVYALRTDPLGSRPCAELPLPDGALYAKDGQVAKLACAAPFPFTESERRQRVLRCRQRGAGPGTRPSPPPGGGARRGPPKPR